MIRRILGVAVLTLALLCSLVIAKAGGLRVSGTGALPPGLDAPSVGACLGSIVGPAAPAPTIGPSSVSVDIIGETSVVFTDCAADHVGEIVAFRRTAGQTASGGSGTVSSATPGVLTPGEPSTPAGPSGAAELDPTGGGGLVATLRRPVPDGDWCRQIASDYRSNRIFRFRDAAAGLWVPETGQRFVAILSAPSGDPAEQQWAACAIVSPGMETYRGLYMSSLAENPTPAPFGRCRSGDPADQWVSCVVPHGSQIFGTAAGQPMSEPAADDACRSLISAMTGMADISAGGALRAVVIGAAATTGSSSGSDSSAGDAEGADEVSDPSCRLSTVGAGRLVGTLIGIGQRPVPLA